MRVKYRVQCLPIDSRGQGVATKLLGGHDRPTLPECVREVDAPRVSLEVPVYTAELHTISLS